MNAPARCPTLPALMKRLAAPRAVMLSLSPYPMSPYCGFGKLNQCKSPGAAGRVWAELSRLSDLWQRGDVGEFCTERCPFISKESCVSLWSLPRGRGCLYLYGSCQHHPSPCQKEHQAPNFPLETSPPPSAFLRPPPKTAAIAHSRSSKAGSELFKSTAGILIIHVKHALLANDSQKLSQPAQGGEEPCQELPTAWLQGKASVCRTAAIRCPQGMGTLE